MQDIDAETFTHFTQFVYSGWYSCEKIDPQQSRGVQSYKTELLSHAKLWAFANTYHVWPLKHLTLTKLAGALESWELSPVTFIADFGGLVRYAYGLRFGEELRGLICWFAAQIAENVYHLEGWQRLLREIAGFTLGLIAAMGNRLA